MAYLDTMADFSIIFGTNIKVKIIGILKIVKNNAETICKDETNDTIDVLRFCMGFVPCTYMIWNLSLGLPLNSGVFLVQNICGFFDVVYILHICG